MSNKKKIQLMKPNVGKAELELITQVIESGYLVEGSMVKEFEKFVVDYIGVEYAIACTSATIGLELALRALKIETGDEVIIPDFTHPATALVIQTLGAQPVLADVELSSYNINSEIIEGAITKRTKAIIPVSIFGNPLNMNSIMKLCHRYEIPCIEDAACSLGSEYQNKKVGSIADISVFSFHPRKIFTTGDGGLIVTNYEKYAELMLSMKKFGSGFKDNKLTFVRWGTNYRMSDVLGAIALAQVRKIKDVIESRIEKAKLYDCLLKDNDNIVIPKIEQDSISNYQTYAIYIKEDKRDFLLNEMRNIGIEVQIGTYALHLLPAFKDVKKVGTLSNSLLLHKNLLALPLHSFLSDEDQCYIVKCINNLIQNS